jgi:hypothetical protein
MHASGMLLSRTFVFAALVLVIGLSLACPAAAQHDGAQGMSAGDVPPVRVGIVPALAATPMAFRPVERPVGPAALAYAVSPHPYHGNLYYNAARSNGYSYWASAPFAFFGSWTWEYFGETHPAAPNDWINTSLGGMAMGEMLFRFSNLILDNTATGARRTWREFFAALLNPMQGLNRLLHGDVARVTANPEYLYPSQLSALFSLGARRTGRDVDSDDAVNQMYANFEIFFGDAWEDDVEDPFDVFDVDFGLATGDVAAISHVTVHGLLYNIDLSQGDRVTHRLGIAHNYTYDFTRFYSYGAMDFGVILHSSWGLSDRVALRTAFSANGMLLGATTSEFGSVAGREYDYGPGLTGRAEMAVRVGGYDYLRANYGLSWINTSQGAESDHVLQGFQAQLNVPIAYNFGLGLDYAFFRRDSTFDDFPDTNRRNNQVRAYAIWHIGDWR